MENEYWRLIESTQQISNPGFVVVLKTQSPSQRNTCRAAAFESRARTEHFKEEFTQFEMLRNFLDNSPNDGAEVQRIIVLEDLPRSFVEVIGSRPRIPPSFFRDH